MERLHHAPGSTPLINYPVSESMGSYLWVYSGYVMSQQGDSKRTGSRRGSVERIHIAPETGGEPVARESVDAVADRGLREDRYFKGEGIYNDMDELEPSDVTLIEAEALEAVATDYDVDFEPGAHRRNITTRGVALNHLVGEQFTVGEAVIEGIELCEPCGYMQELSEQPDAAEALKHRGGLDARIVESGEISVGDEISW
jgi:hypothetical protein